MTNTAAHAAGNEQSGKMARKTKRTDKYFLTENSVKD
jgi:hypothetical protein